MRSSMNVLIKNIQKSRFTEAKKGSNCRQIGQLHHRKPRRKVGNFYELLVRSYFCFVNRNAHLFLLIPSIT